MGHHFFNVPFDPLSLCPLKRRGGLSGLPFAVGWEPSWRLSPQAADFLLQGICFLPEVPERANGLGRRAGKRGLSDVALDGCHIAVSGA
jgi:hypothetical protein